MAWKGRTALVAGALALVGALLYRDVLYELAVRVASREDASHGLFVPLIAGYLAWWRLKAAGRPSVTTSLGAGLGTVGLGLGLFALVRGSPVLAFSAFSFLVVACGLITVFLGRSVARLLAFPLFYLAAMFPIPEGIYNSLAQAMRQATTWGSVGLLQLFRFPIFREGFHVSMPNIDLFVAMSCSGIRYLVPYLVFGLAYAYLTRPRWPARVVVVAATVPIAVLAGIMRQTCVFLSVYYIGPFMAEHRPHVFVSWSVFVTVLALALWADKRRDGAARSRAAP